ncbi:MAG: phage tail tape measure protein, partial [Frankiales bacterium]|nr:phage tail tape measure protein [Frankiales bacterium]
MTSPLGGPRVLETVLTARNLLSPELLKASRDVVAFNSTVMAANEKAAASGAASARAQQSAAASSAAASSKAASAATAGATTQSGAADKIAASNVKASTSASTSADQQKRAYAKAAESATVSARIHETANRSLAASNGLLGTSLTPLTAGLGAVALGLGYAAFKGMDFDKSMSQVQAATQASAGTMSQLRDAAIDAGTKTQYSAVEAAQGITELSKAGVSAKDIMSGGLSGALSLAAAGQLEVGDAAETAATALTVFGLRGNEVNHVADLLAAGAGKAQGSVSDLSQAMNQSALVAKNTGLSIDDTVGALAEFASNGLLGSDAGTSFKNMLQRLNPQSVQAATLMDDLNLHAYDAQGNFVGLANYAENLKTSLSGMSQEQRNAALTTLFGSDAIRAATILYQDGAKGVQEWTGKVNDSGFAARVAKQLMDNLGGDLNNLSSSAEAFFIQLGEGAQGPLRLVVEALTAVVNVGGDVLGFWNSLPGPVQVAVLALGGVAALKGPVGSALETIALKALYMRDSVAGASIGMGGLKAAGAGLLGFFGGPWGLAITGATVGLSLLVSWLGKSDDATSASARATQTATEAQQSYKQALSATNGVMDESVRRAAAKALQDNGLLDVAERLHISTRSMTDSLLGNKDAYEQILPVLEAYYTSLLIQSGYDHTDATDKKAAAVKAQIDAY